jgi:cytochrome P450
MMRSDVSHSALPGPRPMPLLGARGNLIPFMRNPIGYMGRLHRNYGEIVSLARKTTEYVFVFAPEYNQQVLSNTSLFYNLDPSSSPLRIPQNSALSRLFAGLTQINGARHTQQRQLMMPAFQKKRMEDYYGDIVAVTKQRLAGWRVGQQRDLFQEMRELTLSIAVKVFVGLDPNQGGDAMCQLLERWVSQVFSLSAMALPFNLPGLSYHRLTVLSEELEDLLRSLIERKRASGSGQNDVLSTLMQAHDEDDNRLTDEELIGQTNFLFMAGHATTASALTWTLFLLAQHPHIMNDVLDECEGKLHGGAPTIEQLDELPLLESVIKEGMRLLPPVLWWGRISTAPFNIGPYELPCGTRMIHSAYITHRIADLYPEPDKFLPERWRTARPGPYEYVPFSAGPRGCLGAAFAMMEIKVVLASILQRYRVTLPPGSKIDFGGMMLSAPKSGMPIQLNLPGRSLHRNIVRGNILSMVNLN